MLEGDVPEDELALGRVLRFRADVDEQQDGDEALLEELAQSALLT